MTAFQKTLSWVSSLIGAFSCWWMAYAVYRAVHLNQAEVYGMPIVGLYLLEFILIHAGSIPLIAASKESKSAKIVSLSVVSVIYVTFIGLGAVAFHNRQLLLTFFGIMLPRWVGFFTDSDAVRQTQISRSVESTLAFVFALVPTALLFEGNNPFAPGLVIYFAVMGLLEGTAPLRKKGLDQSQRAGCVIGALLFICVAVVLGVVLYRMIFAPLFQK